MEKSLTIRQKLMQHIRVTLVIVIAVFSVLIVGGSLGVLIRMTNDLQLSQTETVAERVGTWYAAREAEVLAIRNTIEEYDLTGNTELDLKGYLTGMLAENESKGIFDYYVGLEDGSCFFGGGWEPGPDEYDPRTRDWYIDAAKSKDTCFSSAYVDAQTGRVVITISVAIRNNGQLVGVMAADIFTDDMQLIASSAFGEKESKYVVIVDSAGTVIAHKNEAWRPTVDSDGNELLTAYTDAKIPSPIIGAASMTRKVSGDHKGLLRIYTGEYLQSGEVTVMVVDTALHFYRGVLLFLFAAIVLAALAIHLSEKSTRQKLLPLLDPLGELMGAADSMARGDLSYKAEYTDNDEIGTLCKAIEESNMSIRGYISDVEDKLGKMANGDLTAHVDADYAGDFAALKTSINGISDSLKSSMRMILESSDSVHGSTAHVADEAKGLAEKVADVSSLIDDTTGRIQEVKGIFEINISQADRSQELSAQTREALDVCNERLSQLTEAMAKISEKSDAIAEIIQIINSIAAQTNLLALNASIEAAHAGDAGRGFAVVADSVRELADQTKGAVADSEKLISESASAVEEGNRLVGLVVESMEDVAAKTADVDGQIQSIAQSIREETAIIDGVTDGIVKIEDFAEETKATSTGCVDVTEGLDDEVRKMREIVGEFSL